MAKSPKVANAPADQKIPRAQELNVTQRKPIWSFKLMETDGPFSWKRLYGSNVGLVLDRLKNLESMTWGEIEGSDNHFIDRSQCSKEAQDRLAEIKMDDVAEVFSLHITGRQRMVGIRDQEVLRILWYDPEHRVCPSYKKGT